MCVACAALALAVYRGHTPGVPTTGSCPWFSTAKSLRGAATRELTEALRILNDTKLPAAQRLSGYRAALQQGERLLVCSLRAQPAQAEALAKLCAVRWELDPPADENAARENLALIELASRMAPTMPKVQQQLGAMLIQAGRREEALGYLRRAVELAPAETPEVVRVLEENLFGVEEMLAALPPGMTTLLALEDPFFREGAELRYIELLEAELGTRSPELVRAYGSACLRAGQPQRLVDHLLSLGPWDLPAAEVERWVQLSRGKLATRDFSDALQAARRARELRPHDPELVGHLGRVALAAGDCRLAESAFQQTLAAIARDGGDPAARSQYYALIGSAEEQCGAPDRAYDAYKRALALDPDQAVAFKRVREMEEAAGTRIP